MITICSLICLGAPKAFSQTFEGATFKIAAWTFVDSLSSISSTVSQVSGKPAKGTYVRVSGPNTLTLRGAGVPDVVAQFSDGGLSGSSGKRGAKTAPTSVSKSIGLKLLKPTVETITIPPFEFDRKDAFHWVTPKKPLVFKAAGLTFTSLRPMSSFKDKWTMQFDISGSGADEVFVSGAFKGLNAGEPGGAGNWKRLLVEVPASIATAKTYGGKVTVVVGKVLKSSSVKATLTPTLFKTCPHGANAFDPQFSTVFKALPEELKLLN